MKKKYCVYSIVNLANGLKYIGRTSNERARFLEHLRLLRIGKHHNFLLQDDFDIYGEELFDFFILHSDLKEEESMELEKEYINRDYDNLYNISKHSTFGDVISYHPKKEEITKKIKNTLLENNRKLNNEERKAKFGQPGVKNGMYGRTHTEESRRIISQKNTGKPSHMLGKKHTIEARMKLSERASQRTGNKNPFYGKHHSEETKKKLSEFKKGSIPTNIRSVIVEGKEFISVAEAARNLGVCNATIIHRIKSPNPKYKNYHYKDENLNK